jgi:predicted branched-subunit amino acid permease
VLVAAGLGVYLAWVGGTCMGVLFGDLLGDPERWGMDAAFPALFLALLAPQVRGRRPRHVGLLGAAIALALTPFTPPGVPIVAASAACLLGLRRRPA